MRSLAAAALAGGGLLTIACAFASDGASLAFHVECQGATPESQRWQIRYWWSKEISPGAQEPVCVQRQSVLSGPKVKGGYVESAPHGGWFAWIEFTPDAQPAFTRMTSDNVGRRVALLVGGRVVAMPAIRAPLVDPKFAVYASSRVEAERFLDSIGVKPLLK